MELFELSAKLKLDDSSFNRGIDNAIGAGERLKDRISAGAVAVGNLAADMVRRGVSAISGVFNEALDGYADYQQLIGGVETLFKGSAKRVADYAKQSYKTTGLSANDYMDTVTGFSASLLQGLKGDTETAADLANTAITDMADNANKMGTDIQMIQNAYQGFAKGNYMMLDNLKLGYGGTKGEMVRLINDSGILEKEIKDLDGITFPQLIEAIHAIQTEMGITGTTAKEAADTISGSKASLSAAWTDLLSAVGGEGDQERLDEAMKNFKESFGAYMENFIPSLVETVGNSGSLVTAIAESIGDLPSDLLANVADKGLESGADMIDGASTIVNWIIDNIVTMFDRVKTDNSAVTKVGKSLGNFLGESLKNIVVNSPTIALGMISAGASLASSLIFGLVGGLSSKKSKVDSITESITSSISEAEEKATKSQALLDYMQGLSEKYGTAASGMTAWKDAEKQLREALGDEAVDEAFSSYENNLDGAINKLKEFNEETRKSAIMQALVSGQTEQINLLAQQRLEQNRAKESIKIAEGEQGIARQRLEDTFRAYAEEMATTFKNEILTDEALANYQEIAEKGTLKGQSISDMGLEALMDEVTSLGQQLSGWYEDGQGRIWDKSAYDTILDPESLAGQVDVINEAAVKIADAQQRVDALETEIQATKEQIDLTKAVIQSTAQQVIEDTSTAGTAVKEGGDTAGKAIVDGGSVLRSKLEAIAANLPLFGGNYALKATGIDYVPTNGFRAELHRGEGVLTASENQRYRNGMGTSEVVGAIQEMRQDLQNLRLVVGTKTFGRAVVNYGGSRMDGYIGQAESRLASGYGA